MKSISMTIQYFKVTYEFIIMQARIMLNLFFDGCLTLGSNNHLTVGIVEVSRLVRFLIFCLPFLPRSPWMSLSWLGVARVRRVWRDVGRLTRLLPAQVCVVHHHLKRFITFGVELSPLQKWGWTKHHPYSGVFLAIFRYVPAGLRFWDFPVPGRDSLCPAF